MAQQKHSRRTQSFPQFQQLLLRFSLIVRVVLVYFPSCHTESSHWYFCLIGCAVLRSWTQGEVTRKNTLYTLNQLIWKESLYVIKSSLFCQWSTWIPVPQHSTRVDFWGQDPSLRPVKSGYLQGEYLGCSFLFKICHLCWLQYTDCSYDKISICSSRFFHSLGHFANWQL